MINMRYTNFGKLIHSLRIKNNEILGDMAKWLNVRTSYLSSTEYGKAKIPANWITLISEHYHLNKSEKDTLKQYAEESNQLYETRNNKT